MRTTQIIGLNEWAANLVHQTEIVEEIGCYRTFSDARVEPFNRKVEIPIAQVNEVGSFVGMFDEEYPLHEYRMPDGRKYIEFVQAEPWSSGPCIFLALKDDSGNSVPESLWSDEEINNA